MDKATCSSFGDEKAKTKCLGQAPRGAVAARTRFVANSGTTVNSEG